MGVKQYLHLHDFCARHGTHHFVAMSKFVVNCCELIRKCSWLRNDVQKEFWKFLSSILNNGHFRELDVNITQLIRKHCEHCATYAQLLRTIRDNFRQWCEFHLYLHEFGFRTGTQCFVAKSKIVVNWCELCGNCAWLLFLLFFFIIIIFFFFCHALPQWICVSAG